MSPGVVKMIGMPWKSVKAFATCALDLCFCVLSPSSVASRCCHLSLAAPFIPFVTWVRARKQGSQLCLNYDEESPFGF